MSTQTNAELLAAMLGEYAAKLSVAVANADRMRTLVVGTYFSTAIFSLVMGLGYVLARSRALSSDTILPITYALLTVEMVAAGMVITVISRQRGQIKPEVSALASTVNRLIRRASEVYAGPDLTFAERLLLDVRLSEAEAVLYRVFEGDVDPSWNHPSNRPRAEDVEGGAADFAAFRSGGRS